jgi:hypothetical protein
MSTLQPLLDAIGAAPVLPGAKCRGRHHLFDPAAPDEASETVDQRHSQAIGLCFRCPSLNRCADWWSGLPKRKRPPGVVAGQVHQPKSAGRPRKAVS